jgi:RNA polymerase sigma-70 factor (ECF subfamily)
MKVLVAGATGAVGRQLVPRLVARGHEVTGMTQPDGSVISVMALDIADGRIACVRSIVNPVKLSHIGPVADMRALLANRDG